MTDIAKGGALTPAEYGALTQIISKASAADIQALLVEALGKSHPAFDKHKIDGEPNVQDQWDGPPDDMPALQRIMRGASGRHAGGKINIGKPQAASGDGAMRMQDTYSPDMASQMGVAEATQAMGEMMTMMGRMAKSLNSTVEQIGKLVGEVATVKASVTTAAAVKAEHEKEDHEEKDDEKAAAEFLSKATAGLTEAGKLVQRAARQDRAKKPEAAKSLRKQAFELVAKATSHYGAAVALADAHPEIDSVETLFSALYKSVPATEAAASGAWPEGLGKSEHEKEENQEEWPESHKAATTTPAADPMASLAPVLDRISKSLDGYGMLQTDIRGLMSAVQGASKDGGKPPVFDLAKADGAATVLKVIDERESEGRLSAAEANFAREVAKGYKQAAEGVIPRIVPDSRLKQAPPSVQQLFQVAA